MFSIMQLAEEPALTDYISPKFKVAFNAYLPSMLANKEYTVQSIAPALANKYQGDFYALLQNLGLKNDYHWCALRLNGLSGPTQYTGDIVEVKMPKREVISKILSRLNTNKKIF